MLTASSREDIRGFEVFKLDASLQLVDVAIGGEILLSTCLVACDDYDAVEAGSYRGVGPVDAAGFFVDAFIAWISPSLASLRQVRGRTRSFWILDMISVLMEGVYGM